MKLQAVKAMSCLLRSIKAIGLKPPLRLDWFRRLVT